MLSTRSQITCIRISRFVLEIDHIDEIINISFERMRLLLRFCRGKMKQDSMNMDDQHNCLSGILAKIYLEWLFGCEKNTTNNSKFIEDFSSAACSRQMYTGLNSGVEELSDLASVNTTIFSQRGDPIEQSTVLHRISSYPINVPPKYFTSKTAFDTTSRGLAVLQNAIRYLQLKLKKATKQTEQLHQALKRAEADRREALSECARCNDRLKRAEAESSKLIEEATHLHHHRKQPNVMLSLHMLPNGMQERGHLAYQLYHKKDSYTAHNDLMVNAATSAKELNGLREELAEVRALIKGILENQTSKALPVQSPPPPDKLTQTISEELKKIYDALYQSNTRLMQVENGMNSQKFVLMEVEQQHKLMQQYKEKQDELRELVAKIHSAAPTVTPQAPPPGVSKEVQHSSSSDPPSDHSLYVNVPQSLSTTMLTESQMREVMENFVISPMSITDRSLTTHHVGNPSMEAVSTSPSPSIRSEFNSIIPSRAAALVGPRPLLSAALHPSSPIQASGPGSAGQSTEFASHPELDDSVKPPSPKKEKPPMPSEQKSSPIMTIPALSSGLGLPFLSSYGDGPSVNQSNSCIPLPAVVASAAAPLTPAPVAEPHDAPRSPPPQETKPVVADTASTPPNQTLTSSSSAPSPAPVTPPRRDIPIKSVPVPVSSGSSAPQLSTRTATSNNASNTINRPLGAVHAGVVSGSDSKMAFLTSVVDAADASVSETSVQPMDASPIDVSRLSTSAISSPSGATPERITKPPAVALADPRRSPEKAVPPLSATPPGQIGTSPAVWDRNAPQKAQQLVTHIEQIVVPEEPMVPLPSPPPLLTAAAEALRAKEMESSSSSYYYTYSESQSTSDDESDSDDEESDAASSTSSRHAPVMVAHSEKATPERNHNKESSLVLESLSGSEIPVSKVSLSDLSEKKKKSVNIFRKMFSKDKKKYQIHRKRQVRTSQMRSFFSISSPNGIVSPNADHIFSIHSLMPSLLFLLLFIGICMYISTLFLPLSKLCAIHEDSNTAIAAEPVRGSVCYPCLQDLQYIQCWKKAGEKRKIYMLTEWLICLLNCRSIHVNK
eukprot:gene5972-4281_t